MSTQKKPPSEARLRANRANALKSTGPRTLEGKRIAARNAITHALTARDLTALGEAYDALPATIQHFTESWNPRSAFEQSLVIQLATLCLRLNRCARMETGLFDMSIPMVSPDDCPEVVNLIFARYTLSVEGVATEADCKIIGVSATNLGVLMFRARNKLRECLEKKWTTR